VREGAREVRHTTAGVEK